MGLSCVQAADLLSRRQHLSLNPDNQLIPANFSSRFKHAISPGFHIEEVFKVAHFVNEKIQDVATRAEYLPLAESLLTRYKHQKSVQGIFKEFDRAIAPFREQLVYHFPETAAEFQKWKKADLDEEVFQRFPSFVHFLKESKILSQMRATRDGLRIIDGEPAINVEKQWVKESELKARFKYEHSAKYNQVFLYDKTTAEVYTYLDNGFGLQKHHPFLTTLKTPISILSPEDYRLTLECAKKFERVDDADPQAERPHIIQIVSSKVEGPNTNLHNMALNAKHPWFRYIRWMGSHAEVYEVGFVLPKSPILPLMAGHGAFRSPDAYEYTSVEERIVTNIPISDGEFDTFQKFITLHHNESLNLGRRLGFRFDQQNCTAFIEKGMAAINITIPTKLQLKEAIGALLPDSVKKAFACIRRFFEASGTFLKRRLYCIIPRTTVNRGINAVKEAWNWFKRAMSAAAAFLLTPVRLCLGGAIGNRAHAFRVPGERQANVEPPLWNPRNYFSLSSYSIHLPGKLQAWQRTQPSTFIVPNPTKFAIVPPLEDLMAPEAM